MGRKRLCPAGERLKRKKRREMETEQQREKRLKKAREYQRRRLKMEDSATREHRLEVARARNAFYAKKRKVKVEVKRCKPLLVPAHEEKQFAEWLLKNLDLEKEKKPDFEDGLSSHSSQFIKREKEEEEEDYDGGDEDLQDSDEEDGLLQRPEFIPVRDSDDVEEENQLRRADAEVCVNSLKAAMQIALLKSLSVEHSTPTHDQETRLEIKEDALEADDDDSQFEEVKEELFFPPLDSI